ncbi:CoxG family protein [Bradyrhizobium sp. AZCC 2230]|uniref:CoxG family protein n=1 Tax=Bradyrhizobium sp. AZCC 2230 TaxID=3117021 RepID=UPI002FF21966
MKFTGKIDVPAPRAAVFAKLRDAHFFASCVDGVRDLVEIDGRHYTATLETRVAYIKFKFAVAVEVAEIDEPIRVVARVEGSPAGMVGRLTATSAANLEEAGGTTVVNYELDVALTGKLGSLGQPVLKSKAKEMERQFASRIQASFQDNSTGNAA